MVCVVNSPLSIHRHGIQQQRIRTASVSFIDPPTHLVAALDPAANRPRNERPVLRHALPEALAWVVPAGVAQAPVDDFLQTVLVDTGWVGKGKEGGLNEVLDGWGRWVEGSGWVGGEEDVLPVFIGSHDFVEVGEMCLDGLLARRGVRDGTGCCCGCVRRVGEWVGGVGWSGWGKERRTVGCGQEGSEEDREEEEEEGDPPPCWRTCSST